MKNALRAVAAFTILLASVSMASAADFKSVVEEQYATFDKAFNAKDGEAIAELYTDDALLLPPSHEVVKKDGIAKFFDGLFEAGITDHKLELIQIIDASDDMKVTAGKWSVTAPGEDGKPTPVNGLVTHVFEKQDDGSWMARLQTFN